eukprot:scaffold22851_cov174-Isochrysis_galbana.AAC.1
MPPAACRWEPNELSPLGGLMTASTRDGARLPPFCCAPGDARLDGPAGRALLVECRQRAHARHSASTQISPG